MGESEQMRHLSVKLATSRCQDSVTYHFASFSRRSLVVLRAPCVVLLMY